MTAYSFKKRFIVPISLGLGVPYATDHVTVDSFNAGPKRQTIRAHGLRRHAVAGDTLQLYHGMRTKQCFKIGEARCTETTNMIIWVNAETISIQRAKLLLSRPEMEQFAREDGFADAADMAAFWRTEHPGEKFEGLLIKWELIDG